MIDSNKKKTKDCKVNAYVLLKVHFDQSTDDVYELAKLIEDICNYTIEDARDKSNTFKTWYDDKIAISIKIIEKSESINKS